MRLTPEQIRNAKPYLNPLKQREIGFRAKGLTMIENLAVLEDIYEAIDFTDNQLLKLENFPHMAKLNTLLLANNLISVIDENLHTSLPQLTTINLANNKIASFAEVAKLKEFKQLQWLILQDNPLTQMYKNWKVIILIFLPQLEQLNYERISEDERDQAKSLRKSLKKGKSLQSILIVNENYIQTDNKPNNNNNNNTTKPSTNSMQD